MNDTQNQNSTGEQIKSALTDALNTGNFKELNNLVSETVTTALNEVGKRINPTEYGNQNKSQSFSDSYAEPNISTATAPRADIPIWQQRAQERMQKKQAQIQQDWQDKIQRRQEQIQQEGVYETPRNDLTQPRQNGVLKAPAVKIRKVGKVSNVLYQVFGGIGLGITGLITLIRLIAFLYGETTFAGWIVNFVFLALFYGMVRLGLGQKQRLKRAVRYVQLCGHKMYEDIENLAKSMGKNARFVVKDLRKMINLGFFPEGHLDEQKTCLMLNDTIYKQYMETEESRRRREEESKIALTQKENTPPPEKQSLPETSEEQASELDIMVAEGMECIRKLRDLNDRIPGEVISAKLFRMENSLKDIFDSLKEHPEQMHRMHKLMSYYLPTTLKLVEAYEEFDRVSSPGEEIIKAKTEIENTLDTINQAFIELLNNLFQDAVFDVTTDAQVLKTMLAREGLMREMELVPNQSEQPDSPQAQYRNGPNTL